MTGKLRLKIASSVFSIATLFAITLSSFASHAHAQTPGSTPRQLTCANGLLTGAFGIIAQGSITPTGQFPPAFIGPFAQVGLINFDGQGNFSFDVVNSLNGQVQPLATVKGKITVNPDCSVMLLDENNIALRGTVINNGDELLLTPASPGIAVSAKGFRIKPNNNDAANDTPFERARRFTCSNGTIKGMFGFDALGATTAALGLPAPLTGTFASVGQVEYDGAGNVTLSASASFNGLTQTITSVKGTYSVNSDCTFTSRLENGATFFATIVNAGQELLVIQTNNGVSAVGIGKRINPPTSSNRPTIMLGGTNGGNNGNMGNIGGPTSGDGSNTSSN